ncbi:tissue-type plasminogen activator [Heptranchias perlo]|uniref:tissue-type plasminogen activator n=1 Tax=Heptranchias perlo TaxID=212740 RepID=UPI0035596ABC
MMKVLGIPTAVTLLLTLAVASEPQHLRFKRGTRSFNYYSSRGYCVNTAASELRRQGETWLQTEGRQITYCRCDRSKIHCHSVPVRVCGRNKCYNGGQCHQAIYSHHYVCQCQAGYSGQLCEFDTTAQCYQGCGTEYRGTWSLSRSGRECLNWNSSVVTRTRYNGRRTDAQQMGLGNHNYCRNPDNDTMPWCHIFNGHILTWDNCSLPACPHNLGTECYTKSGADYRGTRSYSQSGSRCLSWDSESVRNSLVNAWVPNAHRLGLGSHNHCRNPDGDSKPWCHVKKGREVTWEYCDIRHCDPTGMCGKRRPRAVQFRILGGTSSDITSHPWQAAIFIYNRRSKDYSFLCGGSLIGSCWVLTAAHCFYNRFKTREMKVIMGRTFQQEQSVNDQVLEVEQYFVHKDYDNEDTHNHDIALIKLRSKSGRCVRITNHVRTVCLPQERQRLADWTECEISGYGKEKEYSAFYSKRLKEGNVRLFPANRCTTAHLQNRTVTENMICAGDTRGKDDACKGDSGGPLVCENEGRMNLYGIISWGIGCGKPGMPGVYTKVTNYLDWIQSHMTSA